MWRFRKSFSPLPGVRLTLSPSGISTSVGVGPMRVTAGPRGAYLTTTIPGSGLSHRQALSSMSGSANAQPSQAAPLPSLPPSPSVPTGVPEMAQIQSAGSGVLTTPGIAEFRRLLDQARLSHAATVRELLDAKEKELRTTTHYESWRDGWLLRRIRQKRFAALQAAAEEATALRTELAEQEELARLGTQIDLPDSIRALFARFCDSFDQLSRAARIWDTVSHRAIDRVAERSIATRAVERKRVAFRLGGCEVIQSEWRVPHLENANGGDLFLYPLFLVYFAGEHSFALLEYKDVQLTFGRSHFAEEEAMPSDAKVIGNTWAKTNKDGSPDRRFKENYQIPVAEYGKLVFTSSTGLNEEYMISTAPSAESFVTEWEALVRGIAKGQ